MKWKKTWKLIKSDLKRKTLSDGKKLQFYPLLVTALSPSVMAVFLFRLQHYFYHNNLYVISKLIGILNIMLFAVEIGSECQVDEGLILGHANGIIIHDQVIIGKNCTLMHQCGIGIKYLDGIPREKQFTILEDGVLVAPGARIMGPGVIGKKSVIGMNSVVTGSFPERSIIAGIPARIIRRLEDNEGFMAEPIERNYSKRPPLSFIDTLRLIEKDLKHRAYIDGKKFTWHYYIKLFLNPPAMAVFIFRWASFFDRASLKYLTKILSLINIILLKTDIGPKAEINGGFVLGHANGVLINNQVKIGKNAVFFHHNSVATGPKIGMGLSSENEQVIIGNNFFAGAGACILGNIKIGNNCIAGMNAVINKSAPSGSVLAGIPAESIKRSALHEKKHHPERTSSPVNKKPTLVSVLSTIKKDIDRRAQIDNKKSGLYYYLKVLFNPAAMAVVLFRMSNYFERNGLHLPAKLLYNINNILFTTEIQPKATIGPGLVLAHANGILIHEKTIMGENCILTLQNSISIGPKADLDPENDRTIIGDNVLLGMGSKIIGNITLGDSVVIGANAVVTKSAPDGAVLVGVPAVNKNKEG
jgi:serine O-acetyltransferase